MVSAYIVEALVYDKIHHSEICIMAGSEHCGVFQDAISIEVGFRKTLVQVGYIDPLGGRHNHDVE